MVDHRERFILLDHAICDRELSDAAARLYCYLNQKAGKEGQTHRKRQTIADDLGWCIRKVSAAIRELEHHHYLVSQQLQRSQEYTLAWSPGLQNPASLESVQGCKILQGRVARSCKPDPPASLYDPSLLTKPSTIEDGRSVAASSTSASDRPTDPPEPPREEPTTPEDLLLIGLANRDLAADCRMAAQVIELLGIVTVEFFLDSLDVKLRRKHRLHQDFDLAWLPQAARDAVSQWRSARMAHEWRSARIAEKAV